MLQADASVILEKYISYCTLPCWRKSTGTLPFTASWLSMLTFCAVTTRILGRFGCSWARWNALLDLYFTTRALDLSDALDL